MTLSIPEIPEGADNLTAALLYAEHGWYVGPLRPGAKNPRRRAGKVWHYQSSRNAEQIREWFSDTDYDVFIHVGRSGAVVFDVDYPDKTPAVLAGTPTPRRSSRRDLTSPAAGTICSGSPRAA